MNGLTEEEVKKRIEEGKVNKSSGAKTKSEGRIIRENVCTLFNLLNVILAILILISGSYRNLLFMIVVILNTVISTYQEIHSKHIIDKLSVLAISKIIAIRSGKEKEIPIDEIVLDDILKYKSGNQVAVDSEILDGEVEVNESFITGESDTIIKKKGDTLLSGSFIVSGTATAKVVKVGADNFVNKISEGTKEIKKINSEIMKSLNQIIKVMSIIIVPIGTILYINQFNLVGNMNTAIVNTVAALVGMIPEGLILLTSSVLALSCIRLAKSNVLVQQLYCIETLARVDTVCFDKTGTLTEGRMQVEKIVNLSELKDGEIKNILANLMYSLEDDNSTAQAVRNFVGNPKKKFITKVKHPFSSKNKYSGVEYKEGNYYLGAPEFILKKIDKKLQEELDKYTDGYRVLVLVEDKKPLSLILIADIIRKEAKDTINYFKEQGVTVKIISGDNPITVSKIAEKCGVDNATKYVDMSKIKDKDILDAAEKYTVFGRVSPEQKKLLVKILKGNGHTVAMTGDGVNDVLALREADCGVAMANGSDATKKIAELVLLDSNFASMPKIVEEGRQTINNIQRSASLFIVKTIYSSCLALLFIILNMKYPFAPIQMTLISTVTIGIPSFLLALEPNKERVKGKFMTTIIKNALPTAIMTIVFVVTASLIGRAKGIDQGIVTTICIILAGVSGLALVFKLSLKRHDEEGVLPFSIYRVTIAITMSILFYIGLHFFDWLFLITKF